MRIWKEDGGVRRWAAQKADYILNIIVHHKMLTTDTQKMHRPFENWKFFYQEACKQLQNYSDVEV